MAKELTVDEIKSRCEKVKLIYVSHKYVDNGNGKKRGTIVTTKCECGEILTIDVSTLKRYVEQGKEYHCQNCAIKIRQEKRMQDNTDKFKKQCEKVGLVYVSHFVNNKHFYVIAKCQCGDDIQIDSGDLGQYAKKNKIYSCKKCAQTKRGLSARISTEEIIKRCEAVNLKYVSHDYINVDEEHIQVVVNVQCQCGELINNVRLSNITEKIKKHEDYVCKQCGIEKVREYHTGLQATEETRRKISESKKGKYVRELSPRWKGGEKSIRNYLRNLPCVTKWGRMAREQANYTCQLTGLKSNQLEDGKLPVHHLYSFNNIVEDAHNFYNIEFKTTYGEYTEEELKLLIDYIEEWHKDTNNAVVLCEEIHRLFHRSKENGGYGQGNNTPEQFEEFKERYLNGEFDSKAEDVA